MDRECDGFEDRTEHSREDSEYDWNLLAFKRMKARC